ncbi:MAG TPA: TIGR00725 family protein [Dehalococcoidia bacterium]|nr:TIGR00725 family protein [Dehalococcoidia bacterium]
MTRRRVVAVIGAGDCDEPTAHLAEEVGRLLARRKTVVVTGGLGGVMEATSRGAAAEGGLVVGIVPTASPSDANAYVDIAIATGMGEARNAIIAHTAEALIVVAGGWGTLSEIAFALRAGKRVVTLGAWSEIAGVERVGSPGEAVDRALA